jgi:sterol desaturase/sphingolipid hydroxylase (fatty acid hydroxylase superfamily)
MFGIAVMSFQTLVYKICFASIYGFPLISFLSSLVIAIGFFCWRRMRRHRSPNLRAIMRGLFPTALLRSASSRVDMGFVVVSTLVFPSIVGYFIISEHFLFDVFMQGLTILLGSPTPSTLPDFMLIFILSVVSYLAYEIAYWTNHYLSHRVPFLWEFHKIHHTAQILSPLTNFRVHIIDTIIFCNFIIFTNACFQAVYIWFIGRHIDQLFIGGLNIFLFIGVLCLAHLQHTHIWIAFRGVWGTLLISPAHHQLHHSDDPRHYNCNYGSFLGIWDWMAGTLIIPAREREALSYGVLNDETTGSFIQSQYAPFLRVYESLKRSITSMNLAPSNSPIK